MIILNIRWSIWPKAIIALMLIGFDDQSGRIFAARQPIEDPTRAMIAFYKALHRTETAATPSITRIIHYGDSHVAADIMTGALRNKFQLGFGVAAAGESRGVIYDALGKNGARATDLLAWDWQAMADNLERRDPALIVVAYGSNEVGDADLDVASYEASFRRVLARFRKAAPNASILVISPPERMLRTGTRWQTIPRMRRLVEAQRQAALGEGAAFWNLFQAMGGAGSIERWVRADLARPDRVHLTRMGYRLVAEMLYAELMRGYLWALIAGSGEGNAKDRERAGAVPAYSPGL